MDEIEWEINQYKNNIIQLTNKINEIINLDETNMINDTIILEKKFLSSLINIKFKLESK